MRTYITPVKLNKFDSNVPDWCTKCMEEKGTLFHCMWQSRKIKAFWEEVKRAIETVIWKDLLMNPALFILGSYPTGHKYTLYERILMDLCLLYAKKSIALFWKKTSRPTVAFWIWQMLTALPMEKITYIQRGKPDLFWKVWEQFILFVKDQDLTEEVDWTQTHVFLTRWLIWLCNGKQ